MYDWECSASRGPVFCEERAHLRHDSASYLQSLWHPRNDEGPIDSIPAERTPAGKFTMGFLFRAAPMPRLARVGAGRFSKSSRFRPYGPVAVRRPAIRQSVQRQP